MTRPLTSLLWAALVALAFFLFPACTDPPANDTGPEGDADTDADADGDSDADADADTDAEYAIWVHAGTEAAFSLYSEDDPPAPGCEGVIDCWITVPGPATYTVYGKLEGWIFVPQTIDVTEGNKKPAVDWTSRPGLEGYAPQGMYLDEHEEEVEVETAYGDPDGYYGYDHVFVSFSRGWHPWNLVTHGEFVGEDEYGFEGDGTISENLQTVYYHAWLEGVNEFYTTLTKIE